MYEGPLPLGFPAAVLLTIKMLRKRGRFLSIFLPCLRGLPTIYKNADHENAELISGSNKSDTPSLQTEAKELSGIFKRAISI